MILNSVFKNTVLLFVILMISCGSSSNKSQTNKNNYPIADIQPFVKPIISEIQTGADNFEAYIPFLKDKKIGVVTNQTGGIHKKGK